MWVVDHMMKVLLVMYEVVYTCNVDVFSEWYACSLFVVLLSMCEVMRLHMYIALVCLE